jgi:3-phosphoshikimate 1-carboxyvinyltransferase
LKIKETDRISALINELAKLGYVVYEPAESQLAWNGKRCEPAKEISPETVQAALAGLIFG